MLKSLLRNCNKLKLYIIDSCVINRWMIQSLSKSLFHFHFWPIKGKLRGKKKFNIFRNEPKSWIFICQKLWLDYDLTVLFFVVVFSEDKWQKLYKAGYQSGCRVSIYQIWYRGIVYISFYTEVSWCYRFSIT